MSKQKYILLVPLTYNDGSEVPKEIRDRIDDEIFELAGGHYTAGTGQGAYRMSSGKNKSTGVLKCGSGLTKKTKRS